MRKGVRTVLSFLMIVFAIITIFIGLATVIDEGSSDEVEGADKLANMGIGLYGVLVGVWIGVQARRSLRAARAGEPGTASLTSILWTIGAFGVWLFLFTALAISHS